MKKILITGASGFIGSHLVEKAISLGMETYAGIRKNSSRKYLTHPQIQLIELDFSHPESIRSILKKYRFDYIIHNAGTTHAPDQNTYTQVNCGNLQILVELIQEEQIPIQKLIFMSSLAAYGPNECHSGHIIDSKSTPHPVTSYGKSKLQAEQYLKKQTIPYVIIRPTAVYGPRDKEFNAVYQSIENGFEFYFTRKEQKLTFIYIDDLVQAIFKSLNGPDRAEYFVTDGQVYTLHEFYQTIKTILNKKTISIHFPLTLVRFVAKLNELIGKLMGRYPFFNREKVKELAALEWICDTSSLTSQIGFKPHFSLKKGLIETLSIYHTSRHKNH